ncbi:MAG: hypothetical protein ABW134_11655 [Candidatus Thiodiazotropha endolucinida]
MKEKVGDVSVMYEVVVPTVPVPKGDKPYMMKVGRVLQDSNGTASLHLDVVPRWTDDGNGKQIPWDGSFSLVKPKEYYEDEQAA